jgi:hypothetical protein
MDKEQELIVAEIIIKVSAIERLLIKSGIITTEALTEEMRKISEEVLNVIRSKMKN